MKISDRWRQNSASGDVNARGRRWGACWLIWSCCQGRLAGSANVPFHSAELYIIRLRSWLLPVHSAVISSDGERGRPSVVPSLPCHMPDKRIPLIDQSWLRAEGTRNFPTLPCSLLPELGLPPIASPGLMSRSHLPPSLCPAVFSADGGRVRFNFSKPKSGVSRSRGGTN